MQNNFAPVETSLLASRGIVMGARSGLLTLAQAGADVFAFRNLNARPIAIDLVRVRFASTAAFSSAQSMYLEGFKVYNFSTTHSAGGTAVRAHYKYQAGVPFELDGKTPVTEGGRVPATEIVGYIVDTTAITGGAYDAPDAEEPEFVAVGAGSTLPGVYEDYCPTSDENLPLVLEQDTGLIVRVSLTMGTAGVGRLFCGVGAHWML